MHDVRLCVAAIPRLRKFRRWRSSLGAPTGMLPFALAAALVLGGTDPATVAAQSRDAYTPARNAMVDDAVVAEGIRHEGVIQAMRTVPRHLFVRQALRPQAYFDQALDIGHKQTISPPFIVAFMTEVLDPQPTDRVLEIGTGSGYQAAVLSQLVRDVYTIEIVEPLAKRAESVLKTLKYDNVQVRAGDGYLGWPEQAPFDKIIVTCSPESVPQPLIDQLREGGKLIVPLGERYQQVFYLFEKQNGQLQPTRLFPTLFVPMTGAAESARQVQPDPLRPQVVNGGFELDDDEDGLPNAWHYARRTTLVRESPHTGEFCVKFENDEPGRTAHILQGMAVDGRKVLALRVQVSSRGAGLGVGAQPHEAPGLVLHFYDENRKPLADVPVGPWLVDAREWRETTHQAPVPQGARELIIQVGLNGGVGTLWIDDVAIRAVDPN